MANSVGPIGATIALKYALAVAGKQQQEQADSGQQSLALIQSAAAPQLATSGAVGTKLNVVA
ncbi:MAG: hypothetical protein ABJB12_16050 [Pseudomonadota bacterium]